MGTFGIICLCILALVIVIGIIRVIITPSAGFFDSLGQIFLLDLLFDLLSSIGEFIGDSFDA